MTTEWSSCLRGCCWRAEPACFCSAVFDLCREPAQMRQPGPWWEPAGTPGSPAPSPPHPLRPKTVAGCYHWVPCPPEVDGPYPNAPGGSQALHGGVGVSPFDWEMMGQTGCPGQLGSVCSSQRAVSGGQPGQGLGVKMQLCLHGGGLQPTLGCGQGGCTLSVSSPPACGAGIACSSLPASF